MGRAGVPTTDGEGKEMSKGASKKLAKEWKVQEKAHAEWLEQSDAKAG